MSDQPPERETTPAQRWFRLAEQDLGPDMAERKSRLDGAFAPLDGFIDYREAEVWASDVHATLDETATPNAAGHHGAAIELCEHALAQAEASIQYVDDSDGWITSTANEMVSGGTGEPTVV